MAAGASIRQTHPVSVMQNIFTVQLTPTEQTELSQFSNDYNNCVELLLFLSIFSSTLAF